MQELIPTPEGFSVAHVEKHWCLLSKSLITCKVILPTQSNQLDAIVLTKLFKKKEILVKFEMLFTEKISGIILGDMNRPGV
jgi:hypothetical protein